MACENGSGGSAPGDKIRDCLFCRAPVLSFPTHPTCPRCACTHVEQAAKLYFRNTGNLEGEDQVAPYIALHKEAAKTDCECTSDLLSRHYLPRQIFSFVPFYVHVPRVGCFAAKCTLSGFRADQRRGSRAVAPLIPLVLHRGRGVQNLHATDKVQERV
jgi:hypothetical protein